MEQQIKTWLGSGSINLFGLPYAGKDTQAQKLAEKLNATVLGGGEILRNSVIPPHVKEVMEAGDLIPTPDYIAIVLPYLGRQELAGQPLILSSVGRWHGEEDGVMQATEQSGHPIKAVIFLNIDETILRQRWEYAQSAGTRGERADDAEEKLATRLAEFREKTLPVIEYYRQKGLLIEVDGSQDVETVNKQIFEKLTSLASATQ